MEGVWIMTIKEILEKYGGLHCRYEADRVDTSYIVFNGYTRSGLMIRLWLNRPEQPYEYFEVEPLNVLWPKAWRIQVFQLNLLTETCDTEKLKACGL